MRLNNDFQSFLQIDKILEFEDAKALNHSTLFYWLSSIIAVSSVYFVLWGKEGRSNILQFGKKGNDFIICTLGKEEIGRAHV